MDICFTSQNSFKERITSYCFGRLESPIIAQHINDTGHNIETIHGKSFKQFIKRISPYYLKLISFL